MKYYWVAMLSSPRALMSLSIGVFVVLTSMVTGFEVPSSGAVMICSCIIAEILHLREPWRGFQDFGGAYVVEKDILKQTKPISVRFRFIEYSKWLRHSIGHAPKPTDEFISDSHNMRQSRSWERLECFAKFRDQSICNDKAEWHYNDAAYAADKMFTFTNATFAISGSLLWAYGHLIWS